MRAASALSALSLAACFGSGPTPPKATNATVVFAVAIDRVGSATDCSLKPTYIGSVAIGSTGFAVILPARTPHCMNTLDVPVPVFSFDKLGADPAGVVLPATLGNSGSTVGTNFGTRRPRSAASGSDFIGAYVQQGQLTCDDARSGSGAYAVVPEYASVDVAGFVFDATQLYAATWFVQGDKPDPNDPTFPRSQPAFAIANGSPMYSLTKATRGIRGAPGTGSSIGEIPFACESIKDCLVQNSTTLFFAEHGSGGTGKIGMLAKTAMTVDDRVTFAELDPSVGAVGLAADDTHVAWTAAVDSNVTTIVGGCDVFVRDLATGTNANVLSTKKFSCMDAALDATSVYFTIVSIDDTGALHGDGIGRVSIATGDVETLALGMVGAGAGPRRVYLDGDEVYAVDPLVIGKIAKSVLDGAHDFE